jgi:hypothetical protein
MRNVISRLKRRRLLAIIPVLATVASVGGFTTLGSKSGSPPVSLSSKGISLAQARAAEIPTYYPGNSAEGNPLNVILRGYNRSPINDIDFIYGDCVATSETGCAPPIEVQVWPACMRNLSFYDGSPGALPAERTTIRGAPAAFLDNGARLEIQTGIVTIAIFASARDEALRVANALRGLNVNLGAGKPFPPPAKGALEGKLSCS